MTAPGSDERLPRVLVTGGSGFIGTGVVPALRDAGARVVVADLDPYPDGGVPTVQGDLRHARVRRRAVTGDLDAIVHLAALTSVLESKQRPAAVHATNVAATAGLLELARERDVGAFVLASTNAVVGDVGYDTITEDTPLRPLTPYGATKAAAEMLLSGYGASYPLRTCALRLTNVYGHGMQTKDSFVARLMRAARDGHGVEIYGDGEQRRDLVARADVARALVAAAIDEEWSGPVIIGSGRSVTVNELTGLAREASGVDIPATHGEPRPGEMRAVIVDPSRARRLGFTPRIPLEQGLVRAWEDLSDR